MVFSRIGKNEPRNTRKIAGLLAMPNQMMARGIHDTGGIGRKTCKVGSMMVSIRLDQPIVTPSDTASTVVGAGSSAAGSVPDREKISQPTRISTGTIHRSSPLRRSDFIALLNSRGQTLAFQSQPRETDNPDS